MQSLSIADAGYGYIFKCIAAYYEGNLYFILYLISVAFLSVKGGKRMREIFLPQLILMALTVYNPVFPVALNSIFDVNKEYYRFLWMAPVIVSIACAGVVVCTETAAKTKRSIPAVMAVMLILAASGTFLYKDGYILSPNIYHMPTEIPQISEMIHEDSEAAYPRAMFEYDYNMLIRQYDASIMLSCDREAYLDAVSGKVTYESAMEGEDIRQRLLAVVGLDMQLPVDAFREGLEETHTRYVVVSTEPHKVGYLEDCGMEIVGETANHTILRYEPEDPADFEPGDYSDVWKYHPKFYDVLL